ncbi:MAG: putative zinc-binding protein [Candidatus Syntropharchaeales archaeon]
MAERRSKKAKPICLFPCSGFNIPGEAVRMASGIISEEIYPDISETMGIVELTRAFIDGNAQGFKKKLGKQKVVTIDGCQYQCAREFIRRFLQIEPDREIIFRLADREEVANKITHTKEEDIKEAVRLIKACIDEFNPPAGANP